jgi:hypothetical protein
LQSKIGAGAPLASAIMRLSTRHLLIAVSVRQHVDLLALDVRMSADYGVDDP